MTRAASPAVGTILLLGVTVLLAAVVAAGAFDLRPAEPGRPVVLSVAASAAEDRVSLVHEAGPPLDVRELAVRIEVDGTPLEHQPPVPFFAAKGFRSGPTGPFNPASDPAWEPGERASFRLAGTNAPSLSRGATLSIRVVDGRIPVAILETTVQ